jgi:hypothetical protein
MSKIFPIDASIVPLYPPRVTPPPKPLNLPLEKDPELVALLNQLRRRNTKTRRTPMLRSIAAAVPGLGHLSVDAILLRRSGSRRNDPAAVKALSPPLS